MSETTNPDGSRNMERDRDFAKKHAGHWCCQGGWGEMAAIAFYWLARCEELRGERDKLLHELNECRHNHNRDHERTLSAEIERDDARAALKECREATLREVYKWMDNADNWPNPSVASWAKTIRLSLRAALAADTPRGAECGHVRREGVICTRKAGHDSWHRDANETWADNGYGVPHQVPTPQEDTPRGAVDVPCPHCGAKVGEECAWANRNSAIMGNYHKTRRKAAATPQEDTGEPEPPEHLQPYLATSPPTLSAAEQEHADRVVVEIERDQKGEGPVCADCELPVDKWGRCPKCHLAIPRAPKGEGE